MADFKNESTGASTYSWDFGDGSSYSTAENPEHTFPGDGGKTYTIILTAESDKGCIDTAMTSIYIKDDLIFYIPNTFTPDGNKYNQTFQPVFSTGFDPYNYTLIIFNRWGELIFESHNSEIGWDGTYGDELMQDGTYTWKITYVIKETQETKEIIGHVNIIR